MARFSDKDNYGKPKSEYINSLQAQTDEELYKICENMIWLSAYASNNPRSDYHWQVDACYDECKRRERIDIYQKAYDYHAQ